jgi:penicillin-binding protein 2
VALNLAIGQGEMLLSPLQVTELIAIVATRGNRFRPRLLHAIGSRAGELEEISEAEPEMERIPMENAHMDVVRRGMRSAVIEGTARIVNFPEVQVAAKTGTAENALEDHAVFTAFAPYENPQIAITVYLENRGHGGAAAGPVARRILAGYFGISDTLQVRVVGGTD